MQLVSQESLWAQLRYTLETNRQSENMSERTHVPRRAILIFQSTHIAHGKEALAVSSPAPVIGNTCVKPLILLLLCIHIF